MSSYDELVHEPIKAEEISSGQPFSPRRRADLGPHAVGAIGGVGPLISGLSSSRSISTSRS